MAKLLGGASAPSVHGLEFTEITEDMRTEIKKIISVIDAMTTDEIKNIELLVEESRINRIATNLDCTSKYVLSIVEQYRQMRDTASRVRDPLLGNGYKELPPNRNWTT